MSWAARRHTTRQEDMAYCLLGLFDVNMPMLYGEGAKAFLRLQEEIIRRTNDRSIFAFSSTPSGQAAGMGASPQPYSDLFAASPRDFMDWTSSGAMGSGLYASEAFALTNKGLYFRTVQLLVDMKRGLYVLTLDDDSNSPNNQLQLRKVGPALYSKYIISSEDAQRDCDIYSEATYSVIEEEVYILSAIAPSLQLRLHHADSYAIHLQSRTHQISRAIQAIQRAPSSNRWDASRMLFLRSGARSIIGFWKVFPSLARPITGGSHADVSLSKEHFYLVSGVDPNADQEPCAWVRLYTSQEWRRLESIFGIITNLDDVADHKGQSSSTARLEIPSSIVVASVALRHEQPIFDLSLDFNVDAASQS
ncbi:hypothetical protein G7054_g6308 [Neopestalotiopsis clavispora]|nr:hypothetical protein G7054_g6308 [Neopestalotiopsis clavispora]